MVISVILGYDMSDLKNGGDSMKAICTLCNKNVIDVLHMGISTLVSRKIKNIKQEKERDLNSSSIVFIRSTAGTVSQQGDQKVVKEPVNNNSSQTNSPISVKSLKVMAEDAEIRWALNVVLSHFSYRSCLGTNKPFKTIFPGSAIAKEVSVSKTKCTYVIHFDIAPIFKNINNNNLTIFNISIALPFIQFYLTKV